MHNVAKWSDTFLKSYSKCCKIFKVCLTILGHYALKDLKTSTFLESRSPSYSSKSIHQMKISPNQYYDD